MNKRRKWISFILLIVILTATSNVTYIKAAENEADYNKAGYNHEDTKAEETGEAITNSYSLEEYPYQELEEPSTVQGFEYQLKDNVEFLPEDTEYELDPAPMNLPTTGKKGKVTLDETSDKVYLPGTKIMTLPDDTFRPEQDKIYIDTAAQGSFKVIDEIVEKDAALEVPVMKPSAAEVFEGFRIPRQEIPLSKGNITDLEEGVELVEESDGLQLMSLPNGGGNELPPADTTKSYQEFWIPSMVLYEYPEPPEKDDKEKPKGKEDNENQPTPTPIVHSEDTDAKETGKEDLKIKISIKGGKMRIYEPTLIAEADWDGDFDLGFRSLKVESNVTLEGNITFSKETCIRLYGYGVDFGSDTEILGRSINGHIGIGIYAVFGINGEITITAKIEQAGEIRGGVTGNFWPILLGVPSAIPYATYESQRFDVAVMLDAKIHAWAYIGPQLTLDILDFNLLTIQVWAGVEGDALVTAEASSQGTGSMQMDLSLDFVVLFRAWVFDCPYEKYLLRTNIYKNSFSFAYGETVSADSQKVKDITPVLKLDGVDAYWDTIWGSASYYDKLYQSHPIANIPVNITVTKQNGTVENYTVNTDENGDYSLQITNNLIPSDQVMVSMDQEITAGEYVTKYHGRLNKPVNPEVPFKFRLLESDGFNDIVTGTISPANACPGHPEARNYSGKIKLYVQNEDNQTIRTKDITVRDGTFEVSYKDAADLSGGHKVYATLLHEGKLIESEKVETDLDALKLNVGCSVDGVDAAAIVAAILEHDSKIPTLGIPAKEILYAGTVTNLVEKKAYEGEVQIEIASQKVLTRTDEVRMLYRGLDSYAITKPDINLPEVDVDPNILERMKSQVSTFDGSIGSELLGDMGRFIEGISFIIEYENMKKIVRYNFVERATQTIVSGSINPIDSILLDKIESRINPPDVIMTLGSSQMMVRGNARMIDGRSNTSVMQVGSVVYVPAQAVVEALGGSYSYSAATGKATINLNNRKLTLTKGKTSATLGKSNKTLKAAPFIPGGVFMIPASLLSDFYGYQTTWDSNTKSLTIAVKATKTAK